MQATTVNSDLDNILLQKSKDEYFLVAPWFFNADLKEKLQIMYNFARVTDDIADDEKISESERKSALKEIRQMLDGEGVQNVPEWLAKFISMTRDRHIPEDTGVELLTAFTSDLDVKRYETWDDVVNYCNKSAVPVGRAIIQIFKEKNADLKASDELCRALQIINHVKDFQEDYVLYDRIYFPHTWFNNPEEFRLEKQSDDIAKAKVKILARVDAMLQNASRLPDTINDWRLKAFYLYTLLAARAVVSKLRKTKSLKPAINIGIFGKLIISGKVLCLLLLSSKPK